MFNSRLHNNIHGLAMTSGFFAAAAGILLLLACVEVPAFAEDLREVYEQGDAAYAKGDYKEAIKSYEKATKLAPEFAPAYNALGRAYQSDQADLWEVSWYFKKAIALDPKFAEAYDNLGKAYYGLGHMDKAEEYCKKALEVNPNFPSAQLSLAWIYLLGKSQLPDAIFYFNEVLKQAKLPNAYFGLGMAYFMSDNRGMVLDIITQLRDIGENGLALQLENMVRDKKYVISPDGKGQLVDIAPRELPEDDQMMMPPPGYDGQGGEVPIAGDGGTMRVRLRGKLYNIPEEDQQAPSMQDKPKAGSQLIGGSSGY